MPVNQSVHKLHSELNSKREMPEELAQNENALFIQKVAKNTTAKEFEAFIVNCEVPAIKLTARESEVINGGYSSVRGYIDKVIKSFYDFFGIQTTP